MFQNFELSADPTTQRAVQLLEEFIYWIYYDYNLCDKLAIDVNKDIQAHMKTLGMHSGI